MSLASQYDIGSLAPHDPEHSCKIDHSGRMADLSYYERDEIECAPDKLWRGRWERCSFLNRKGDVVRWEGTECLGGIRRVHECWHYGLVVAVAKTEVRGMKVVAIRVRRLNEDQVDAMMVAQRVELGPLEAEQ